MIRYFRVGSTGLWYEGYKTIEGEFKISKERACQEMANERGIAEITAVDLEDGEPDPRSGDWAEVPAPTPPSPERTIAELADSDDALTPEESDRLVRATAKAAGL